MYVGHFPSIQSSLTLQNMADNCSEEAAADEDSAMHVDHSAPTVSVPASPALSVPAMPIALRPADLIVISNEEMVIVWLNHQDHILTRLRMQFHKLAASTHDIDDKIRFQSRRWRGTLAGSNLTLRSKASTLIC